MENKEIREQKKRKQISKEDLKTFILCFTFRGANRKNKIIAQSKICKKINIY